MQVALSEPRISQRSLLQRNLLAQASQPKSKEEYLEVWDAWAKQPNQGTGEKRKEAVKRMKAWLKAKQPGKLLDLNSLRLASLPPLPDSIQKLNVSWNQLNSLPPLPVSLQELDASRNPLISLPHLPSSLQRLHADYCKLISLPEALNAIVRNGQRIENHPLKSINLQGNAIPEEQIRRLHELIGPNPANSRVTVPHHHHHHQHVGKSDESGRPHR